jgi:hypothetical protein
MKAGHKTTLQRHEITKHTDVVFSICNRFPVPFFTSKSNRLNAFPTSTSAGAHYQPRRPQNARSSNKYPLSATRIASRKLQCIRRSSHSKRI